MINHKPLFLSACFFLLVFAGSATAVDTDTDGDGIVDIDDNCSAIANAGQEDSDGDGFGNICDADITNDCVTGGPDFSEFHACISKPGNGAGAHCFVADFNSDHKVNSKDFEIFEDLFGLAPGPSGLASCP